jgi:hypothetical protein
VRAYVFFAPVWRQEIHGILSMGKRPQGEGLVAEAQTLIHPRLLSNWGERGLGTDRAGMPEPHGRFSRAFNVPVTVAIAPPAKLFMQIGAAEAAVRNLCTLSPMRCANSAAVCAQIGCRPWSRRSPAWSERPANTGIGSAAGAAEMVHRNSVLSIAVQNRIRR